MNKKTKTNKKSKRIIASTGKGKKKKEKNYTSCRQTQCGYFINGGCQKCDECGAKPNKVEDNCKTSFDCENKPNCLRWETKQHKESDKKALMNVLEQGMKRLGKKKQLILTNGEIQNENEMPSSNDFEKELQSEIIRQMATQIISKASDSGQLSDFNSEDFKNKDKDKEEEPKKKDLPYIG